MRALPENEFRNHLVLLKADLAKGDLFENLIILVPKKFFSEIFILKMDVTMNSRIATKNHAADSEKSFLKKTVLKADGREAAMPIVWEL